MNTRERWEWSAIVGAEPMSDLRTLLDDVWTEHGGGRSTPRLVCTDTSYCWIWEPEDGVWEIGLPPHHADRYSLLHEVAHALQPGDSEDHGEEWVRVYVMLLARYAGVDAAHALDAARAMGLIEGP